MSIEREVIAGADVPGGIGPYSPAVRAGDLLYVSGQPGVDPETAKPVGPEFGEQARQAFGNLDAVLRAGGSSLAQVVNTTILVTDIGDFAALNELFGEFFPTEPPARMVMQVPLPLGLKISVGCVAVVGD